MPKVSSSSSKMSPSSSFVTVFPAGSVVRAFSPNQTKVYTGLFMPNNTIRRLRVAGETRRKRIDLGFWENLQTFMSIIPETYRVVVERAPTTAELESVAKNYGFQLHEDGTYVRLPTVPTVTAVTAVPTVTATTRQKKVMILRSEKPRTTALVLADGSVKLLRNGRATFTSFPNPILYSSVAEYMATHGLNEGTVSKHERY